MKTFCSIKQTALAAALMAALPALAANVVVTPGGVAGYLYMRPPASASVGDMSQIVDALACNDTKTFANEVTFTTPGTHSWTVPEGVGCIRIEASGGGGGGGGGGAARGFSGITPPAEIYGSLGGDGGNGGDSYVLAASGIRIALGCGGAGGDGGIYSMITYSTTTYWITTASYRQGGGSHRLSPTSSTGSASYPVYNNGVCSLSSTYSVVGYSAAGTYGGAQGWSPASWCTTVYSGTGGGGGGGVKTSRLVIPASGAQLTVVVGQGGGGGMRGLSTGHGTPGTSGAWLSGISTAMCLENDIGIGGAKGAAGSYGQTSIGGTWALGTNGGNGGDGYVKIYY